jgi:amino acid permease
VRFIFMVFQLILSSGEIRQFSQNQFWFNYFHPNAITESGNKGACEIMSVVVFNLSVFHLA